MARANIGTDMANNLCHRECPCLACAGCMPLATVRAVSDCASGPRWTSVSSDPGGNGLRNASRGRMAIRHRDLFTLAQTQDKGRLHEFEALARQFGHGWAV